MSLTAPVYNTEGKKVDSVTLPEVLFGEKRNDDLIHQVVVSMQENARTPVAHTKGRRDVRGGGKKPWRQKGTGRARHGSRRSPIWRGGGVTHGPTNEVVFEKKVNRKMKSKALASVLSQKFLDNEVIFVDELSFKEPKTKEAKQILAQLGSIKEFEALAGKRKNAACISLINNNDTVKKSFSNMGNVEVDDVAALNPLKLLTYKYLIIDHPKEALEVLEKRMQ